MKFREASITYRTVPGTPAGPRTRIHTASDAARLIAPQLAGRIVEHFGVLSLNTKHEPIGWDVVSMGTVDATLVHPRDVFRAAILHNASAVIVAHNHPSGDPSPSPDDCRLSARLKAAGELLGIAVLDSIIVADGGGLASLRERGELV